MTSIFHTDEDKPQYGDKVVIFSEDGTTESMVWLEQTSWVEICIYYNVVKWAKASDLLALEAQLETAIKELQEIVDNPHGAACHNYKRAKDALEKIGAFSKMEQNEKSGE